jgi:hypothetical protein
VNGLKVPPRQPQRGRLWLNDGSCGRLRPERPNHLWAYDFVEDRSRDGRKCRMLCVVDEFTGAALAIRVASKLGSAEIIDVLADLFIARGPRSFVRTTAPSSWPSRCRAGSLASAPGRPTSGPAAAGSMATSGPSTASAGTSR